MAGIHTSVLSEQRAMENLSLQDSSTSALYGTPQRPAYGTQGKRVDLCANYLKITGLPNAETLFLYTMVATGAREPKGRQLAQIIKIMLDTEHFFCARKDKFATDFAQILISTPRLEHELPEKFTIQWRKELEDPPAPLPLPRIYHVHIEPHVFGSVNIRQVWDTLVTNGVPVSQLDFPDQPPLMQALNVIMAHYSRLSPLIVNVGRNKSFFIDQSEPRDSQLPLNTPISKALEVRRGFFSSVRIAKDGPLLNANSTASLFHRSMNSKGEPMLLSELIAVRSQERGIRNYDKPEDRSWLEELIKGMRVRRADLTIRFNAAGQEIPDARVVFGLANPRDKDEQRATCQGFGSLAQAAYCWGEEDGVRSTVADKYKAFYNGITKIQPVINLGNQEHPDYFLTSMCTVLPGNLSREKLVDKVQQKAMIDFAVLKPQNAKYAVEQKALKTLGLDSTVNRQSISIAVNPKMIDLVGRRLPMPPVKYQTLINQRETNSGSWTMQGYRFHNAKKLDNWVVVRFKMDSQKTDGDLMLAVKNFIEELRRNGMSVETQKEYPTATIEDMNDTKIGDYLRTISEKKYTFALIVLPKHNDQLYKRIKTAGDIRGGFHTVDGIESKFMGKGCNDKQCFSNVSQKINLKLGGTNHIAGDKNLPLISEGKTMIVSYDVTHPPPAPKSGSNVDNKSSDGKKSASGGKSTLKATSTAGPANMPSKNVKQQPRLQQA